MSVADGDRIRQHHRMQGMADVSIREAQNGDEAQLAAMMAALWPDGSLREHQSEAEALIRHSSGDILRCSAGGPGVGGLYPSGAAIARGWL